VGKESISIMMKQYTTAELSLFSKDKNLKTQPSTSKIMHAVFLNYSETSFVNFKNLGIPSSTSNTEENPNANVKTFTF
jgi:hypothetical protein